MSRQDNIEQAINAGELIIENLEKALKYVKSAKRWGIAAFLTEGTIGAIKLSKLKKAEQYIKEANAKADRLSIGVKKVDVYMPHMDLEYQSLDMLYDSSAIQAVSYAEIQELIISIEYSLKQVREIVDSYKEERMRLIKTT